MTGSLRSSIQALIDAALEGSAKRTRDANARAAPNRRAAKDAAQNYLRCAECGSVGRSFHTASQ